MNKTMVTLFGFTLLAASMATLLIHLGLLLKWTGPGSPRNMYGGVRTCSRVAQMEVREPVLQRKLDLVTATALVAAHGNLMTAASARWGLRIVG